MMTFVPLPPLLCLCHVLLKLLPTSAMSRELYTKLGGINLSQCGVIFPLMISINYTRKKEPLDRKRTNFCIYIRRDCNHPRSYTLAVPFQCTSVISRWAFAVFGRYWCKIETSRVTKVSRHYSDSLIDLMQPLWLEQSRHWTMLNKRKSSKSLFASKMLWVASMMLWLTWKHSKSLFPTTISCAILFLPRKEFYIAVENTSKEKQF